MSKIDSNNKAVKFPSHHYIGFDSRPGADNVPLGFMTPDGTDSAATKRKKTVDDWAKGYGRSGSIPAVTYENKPMVGFKLSREVRRYASFGNGNVKWRIEDPRGFELEISSANFAQILMLCTMEKGEIQEQLIWGRLGAENVLVPVDSDAYRAAQTNTERMAKKASLKDLNLGDKVVMQNGDEGVYVGAFFFVKASRSSNSFGLKTSDKKKHVFRNGTQYSAIGSPKIAEIHPGAETFTLEDSAKTINDILNHRTSKRGTISDHTNDYSYTTIAVSPTLVKAEDFKLVPNERSIEDVQKESKKSIIFFELNGNVYCTEASSYRTSYLDSLKPKTYSYQRTQEFWIYQLDRTAYDNGEFVFPTSSRYGYASAHGITISAEKMPDKVTSFSYKGEVNGEQYTLPMTPDY